VREIAILPESVITQLGPDGPEDANTRAILIMLYNAWLHQLTRLRDNLIGPEKLEEVMLNLDDPS
jgi:hypothetical protein